MIQRIASSPAKWSSWTSAKWVKPSLASSDRAASARFEPSAPVRLSVPWAPSSYVEPSLWGDYFYLEALTRAEEVYA